MITSWSPRAAAPWEQREGGVGPSAATTACHCSCCWAVSSTQRSFIMGPRWGAPPKRKSLLPMGVTEWRPLQAECQQLVEWQQRRLVAACGVAAWFERWAHSDLQEQRLDYTRNHQMQTPRMCCPGTLHSAQLPLAAVPARTACPACPSTPCLCLHLEVGTPCWGSGSTGTRCRLGGWAAVSSTNTSSRLR